MNEGGTSEKKHRYDVNLCGREFKEEEKLFRLSFLVWFTNATYWKCHRVDICKRCKLIWFGNKQ